jgi:hypothetical protein
VNRPFIAVFAGSGVILPPPPIASYDFIGDLDSIVNTTINTLCGGAGGATPGPGTIGGTDSAGGGPTMYVLTSGGQCTGIGFRCQPRTGVTWTSVTEIQVTWKWHGFTHPGICGFFRKASYRDSHVLVYNSGLGGEITATEDMWQTTSIPFPYVGSVGAVYGQLSTENSGTAVAAKNWYIEQINIFGTKSV